MSKQFIESYLDAIAFTDCGPDDDPSEDAAFSSELLEQATKDCLAFIAQAGELLDEAGDDSQNGHDFWLTRNRHGVGFWDRGYPKEIGDALTQIAESFGEQSVYEDDNQLLYLE